MASISRGTLEYWYSKREECDIPNESIIKIANQLYSSNYYDISFDKCDIKTTIDKLNNILESINTNYKDYFNKLLNEENIDNPFIGIYESDSVVENDSFCEGEYISFYKTNTTADVFLLMHELSHALTYKNNVLQGDYEREIVPILSEFLLASILRDNSYLKVRYNQLILDAKSLLVKLELINGNLELDELYKKYGFSDEDIEEFEGKFRGGFKMDNEIKYFTGFIYAYYYSLNNILNNYRELIKGSIELTPINDEVINEVELKKI